MINRIGPSVPTMYASELQCMYTMWLSCGCCCARWTAGRGRGGCGIVSDVVGQTHNKLDMIARIDSVWHVFGTTFTVKSAMT